MQTLTSRKGRSVAAGTLLAATALLLTACGSSGSSAAAGAASSPTASATASASAPASAPVSTTPAAVASASPGGAAMQSATDTFLAEGQDVKGTALFKPACVSNDGCALSGDSTGILYQMTWNAWSASEAVGTGTYRLDSCNPDCAAGQVYPVAAVITLTDPVRVCSSAGTRWFWSHASFTFPSGLPKALQGANAPQNPWTFSSVTAAANQGCAGS